MDNLELAQQLKTQYPALAVFANRRKVDITEYQPFAALLDKIYQKIMDGTESKSASRKINSLINDWHGYPDRVDYINAALSDIAEGIAPLAKGHATSDYGKFVETCPYCIEVDNPYYKKSAPMRLFYPAVLNLYMQKNPSKIGNKNPNAKAPKHSLSDYLVDSVRLEFANQAKKLLIFAKDKLENGKIVNYINEHLDPVQSPLLKESVVLATQAEKFLRKNKVHSLYYVDGKIVYDNNLKTKKADLRLIDAKKLKKLPELGEQLYNHLDDKEIGQVLKLITDRKHEAKDLADRKLNFFKKQAHRFYSNIDPATKPKSTYQIFAGPTNSGKTHAALQEVKTLLEKNPDAKIAYLTPLRLLAIEIFEKITEMGFACNLRTGEETITAADCSVTASTVEIFDSSHHDLIIIDEYQMYQDEDRGQAWIRAILNADANKVILVGADDAQGELSTLIHNIEPLMPNAAFDIKYFQRMSLLEKIPHETKLSKFQKGDCLVTFSKRTVLQYAELLHGLGYKVSVLYGDLPLETRRLQADDFRTGKSDVLVATDVIGMGLNLPINRIIFETCTKFDGRSERQLTAGEFKQIAGRAGRGDQTGYFGLLCADGLHYSPYVGSIMLGAPYDDERNYDSYYEDRKYPIRQSHLTLNKISSDTVQMREKVYKYTLPVDINFELLEDFISAFDMPLDKAVADYKAIFKQLSLHPDYALLKRVEINDKLQPLILAKATEVFGGNIRSIHQRLTMVNEAFDTKIDLRTIMTLCMPPINFIDSKHRGITAIGQSYLNLIGLIFSSKDTAARRKAYQIAGIDEYATADLDSAGKYYLIHSMDELSHHERSLVMVSWLNKHIPLLDYQSLKQARFNFAIELFQSIRMAFCMQKVMDTPEMQKAIAERNQIKNFFNKVRKGKVPKPTEEEAAAKSKRRDELNVIIDELRKHQQQVVMQTNAAMQAEVRAIADSYLDRFKIY